MLLLNQAQIEEIRIQKRDLEVEVAKALNGFFQRHYKYAIQKLVRQLILHILTVEKGKLNTFLGPKRGVFLLFNRGVEPTWHGLNEFLKKECFWTIENCSDIIRLFGEANEKWQDLGLSSKHLELQKGLRPEPTFLMVGKSSKVADGGWGEKFGHRHRKELEPDQQVRRAAPYMNITPIVRGVERYEFEEKSVIGAIDRTFGLKSEGGDVSGTTADSIYALKWAGGVTVTSPEVLNTIQLLPLATMVPMGHHTILECAYPLSRWGYIDYHICYYRTLNPLGAAGSTFGRIDAVLAAFDAPDKNKHILVWRHEGKEKGAQMQGTNEIDAFKRVARVLSAYGFCVAGGLRDFESALNIMKTFSPNFLAPRFEQLRGH